MASPGARGQRSRFADSRGIASLALALLLVAVAAAPVAAQDGDDSPDDTDLTELSLEELMDITVRVTSVSKKAEDPWTAPAAVITPR